MQKKTPAKVLGLVDLTPDAARLVNGGGGIPKPHHGKGGTIWNPPGHWVLQFGPNGTPVC
jgi:hypothetical protein